jgi:two-component system, OmpR family, response regulator MprA
MSVCVVHIEDNVKIVEGTKCVMEALYPSMYFVSAYDGIHGLDCILQYRPDIVLIDIEIPGMDGYSLVKRIRDDERIQHIGIIMVTAFFAEEVQLRAFDLGADDYVTKPYTYSLLGARIHALLQRRRVQYVADGEGALRYADIELYGNTRRGYRGSYALCLTSKEFDLLFFFLQHPHQVLSRSAIIENVWGFEYEGESENIVDVYVGYLRKKLEEYGLRLIQTERGVGFFLKELKIGK